MVSLKRDIGVELKKSLDRQEKRMNEQIANGYFKLIRDMNTNLNKLVSSAIENAEILENYVKKDITEVKDYLLTKPTTTPKLT